MNVRTLALLSGSLLLLGLVGFLADRSRGMSAGPIRFFPAFEPEAALRFRITAGTASHDLEKQEGAWRVMPQARAADQELVHAALQQLSRVERADLASRNAATHELFRVKANHPDSLRVQVWSTENAPLVDVYVGKTTADLNSSYLRIADDDQVFRSTTLIRPALEPPDGWSDRAICRVPRAEVRRIEITYEDASRAVLERPESADLETGWRQLEPTPGVANSRTVGELLSTLERMDARGFPADEEAAARALAEPAIRVKVTLVDHSSFELLWRLNPENKYEYFLKRSERTTIYTVADTLRSTLVPPVSDLQPTPADLAAQAPAR